MAFQDETTGLVTIPLSECVRHLESKEVARLAFAADGRIELYPINYIWDGEAIVFRTDPGGAIAAAAGGEVVVEIDHVDDRSRTGWSLILRGVPELVDPEVQPGLSARLARLMFFPWSGGEKSQWLRLLPAPLTGRRIGRSDDVIA